MPITTLHIHRHDEVNRALITPDGEIDLDSAPLLSAALRQCLCDGIRTIDVDLSSVAFCDCSGLNAFLDAAQRTAAVGGVLRVHSPRPALARLFSCTGTGSLLLLDLAAGDRPTPTGSGQRVRARTRQSLVAAVAVTAVAGGVR
jgi:anti-sigma B factor antagonist